jgi:AcrR family transcriptional regulator
MKHSSNLLPDVSAPDETGPDGLPRWRRRKDARPQEIVQAALDLFVEKGYAATRVDDVATRAGVSKGTVYLYCANKQELFEAVVRESLLPVLAEATELIDHYEGSTFDLLDEFIQGWWERVGPTKLSGIMKLVMAEAGNFPEIAQFYHDAFIEPAHTLVTKLLQRGMARGEFRPVDAADMVHVMVAPIMMLFLWQSSFGLCGLKHQVDPQAHVRATIDLLKHGLAAIETATPAQSTVRKGKQ